MDMSAPPPPLLLVAAFLEIHRGSLEPPKTISVDSESVMCPFVPYDKKKALSFAPSNADVLAIP